jgi:protein SCO1/2
VPPEPGLKPDFTLTDLEGRRYDFRRETEGRVTFLFFGYTHCPDICPVHLANLAAALARLPRAEADRVRVVFVTTDPVRDTPERMRRFLDAFDPSFVGLTGTRAELEAAQRGAGVAPSVAQPAPGDTGYAVGHAAQVIAYGVAGRMRAQYPFGTRQKDWAHDLPILLGAGGADAAVAAAPLQVDGGFARVMPTRDVGAAYFTLVNTGAMPDTLRGVEVAHAVNAELHTIRRDGGLARMVPMGARALAPGDTLRLREGGDHLMFDLPPGSPAAGADTLDVTLRFARGGEVRLRLPVRGYGEADGR